MNPFTKHPHAIGETYFQHLKFATQFGFSMMMGGIACLIHAIFPFLFAKTGSNILIKMTHHFVSRLPAPEERILKLAESIQQKSTAVNTN